MGTRSIINFMPIQHHAWGVRYCEQWGGSLCSSRKIKTKKGRRGRRSRKGGQQGENWDGERNVVLARKNLLAEYWLLVVHMAINSHNQAGSPLLHRLFIHPLDMIKAITEPT